MSMNALQVRSVSVQHASLRNATLEKDLLKEARTFSWISRPKHNKIERYFPTMSQMNICRLCCGFSGPIGILCESSFNLPPPKYPLHCQHRSCSPEKDNIEQLYLSIDEVPVLPLCSFNLHDATSIPPNRNCILPYSDVIPSGK